MLSSRGIVRITDTSTVTKIQEPILKNFTNSLWKKLFLCLFTYTSLFVVLQIIFFFTFCKVSQNIQTKRKVFNTMFSVIGWDFKQRVLCGAVTILSVQLSHLFMVRFFAFISLGQFRCQKCRSPRVRVTRKYVNNCK
jgi:hypothetical protein